ncbi:MAG TPA: bifunctional UDP-N-acetylglucosamine diphosphorylase/glucosamine-1-phosphate N-acetyltransferase GlmU [Candidatus Limnocylindrales bacterium]|nr:bifunctional UDP-N-acetylglucosamine diphosphorylase/glucosamine-1-phosphate N-acetyltransferase GlmU [Candidatus Limnocylindrales bacterium]
MTPAKPRTRAVILAAGLGTRMKSRLPKVLHPICGRPMLAYVIDAALEATGEKPLVVYSPQTSKIKDAFELEADFALQQEPRGTGDALRAAVEALPEDVTEVVVLSGDVPLIEAASIATTLDERRGRGAVMALVVTELDDASGYGRVLIEGDSTVSRIVEEKDATPDERAIRLTNAGLYAFDVAWLRDAIGRLTPSKKTGELYLTQLVELAAADGKISTAVLDPDADLTGVNDRSDLAEVQLALQYDILQRHMEDGVTFHDPGSAVVDATVEIEADVTIEPNVILRGSTRIGTDTVIKSGSQIVDSTIGERCTVWASVVESSKVGNDVKIGPFAHLRTGCDVADGAEIGNFAEQKNTRFGARSKQHHFSYLGDAEIGEDVNIGAGTITANYDGRRKHRTIIGNGAFIGSDTILRAPLTVGEGAYTGAGSVVTKDVPPGKLAVGVPARIRERRAQPGTEETE